MTSQQTTERAPAKTEMPVPILAVHGLGKTYPTAGHPLTLRMQPGYDHSYYFIATFLGDHFDHHANCL